MNNKIIKLYQRRQKAHDELLACDIEFDKMLKALRKEIVEELVNLEATGEQVLRKKIIDKINKLPRLKEENNPTGLFGLGDIRDIIDIIRNGT